MLSSMVVRYNQRGDAIFNQALYRVEGTYRDPDAALPMSESEYDMILTDWGRNFGNVFVDKLITINQNVPATESIIERLLKIFDDMDHRILLTLRANITSQANAQFNTPFLRAGLVFCRSSPRPESVQTLIRNVSIQCRGLVNAEGRSFFEFQRDVFHGKGGNMGEVDIQAQLNGFDNLPLWAPGLLGYFDTIVSNEVEIFLQENLLAYGPSPTFEESEGGVERAEAMVRAARRLGIECLTYLRDVFVGRGIHIGNSLVAGLQRVVNQCKAYYDLAEGSGDEMADEFVKLSQSAHP